LKRFASSLSASASTSSSREEPSLQAVLSSSLRTCSCRKPVTPPVFGSSRLAVQGSRIAGGVGAIALCSAA
jgi:hypothetical protein